MKEGFNAVKFEREEKKKKKMERQERLKREEEERQAAEEARQAGIRRAKKKEEKLRKKEENREKMRKEMLMEISLHVGRLDESMQRRYERETKTREMGKQKEVEPSSKEDYAESDDSDVDALSRHTERLVISEKRKRRRRKIPAAPGSVGKLKFVTDNLRQLGNMTVDELKSICLLEDVIYDGKKMQVILAITEKRTLMAYGDLEETTTSVGAEVDPGDDNKDDEKDAESGA
ncbi:hypothetical protein CBR_g12825 [Chara braunii]|uniref:Uncharacterized protein n=1 Tax=Chara braunii TaxID=69332 RepID=A0A388KST8_CHABU|nr:hypothetical protein CBR_g12825 [Chara braunii]|eukprot:GBG73109.1 hypothetical protein CBR_g12825 [Chara braunii]